MNVGHSSKLIILPKYAPEEASLSMRGGNRVYGLLSWPNTNSFNYCLPFTFSSSADLTILRYRICAPRNFHLSSFAYTTNSYISSFLPWLTSRPPPWSLCSLENGWLVLLIIDFDFPTS